EGPRGQTRLGGADGSAFLVEDGADLEAHAVLAGERGGLGLDDLAADGDKGIPREVFVATSLRPALRVAIKNARNILDEAAAGAELVGEEEGGEVRAAAAQECGVSLIIAGDESRDDQDGDAVKGGADRGEGDIRWGAVEARTLGAETEGAGV